jgi:hypothetical protein
MMIVPKFVDHHSLPYKVTQFGAYGMEITVLANCEGVADNIETYRYGGCCSPEIADTLQSGM